MLKKILSIILTVMLVVGCLPFTAIAATAPEASGNSLSATVSSLGTQDTVYMTVYVDAGVTVQGLSFRLNGFDGSFLVKSAEWSSDITGYTSFTKDYLGDKTQCMCSVLFNAQTGYTFTKRTELVKIAVQNMYPSTLTNRTVNMVVDDFYGISGGSDMVDLSTSKLDLKAVQAATMTSITMTKLPNKTTYIVGDSGLDTTGMQVTANYSDSTTKDITNAVTLSTLSTSSAGTKTITVTSNEKPTIKTTFDVTVVNKTLTKIVVTTNPTKTSYYVGDTLNTAGIKITGTYNNGTTADVTSNVTYSGFNSTSAGTKTVTVTSKENTSVTTSFKVTVTAVAPTAITLSSLPKKTSYYVGDPALVTDGMKVTAAYNNGTTADVTSNVTCSGFSSQSAGTKTITVSLNGYTGITASFSVTVEALKVTSIYLSSAPAKKDYFVGDELDTTGLSVKAVYNNGSEKDVTANVQIGSYDKTKAGKQTITVTYEGCTASFDVNYTDLSVSRITVSTDNAKTSYFTGDVFDSTGIRVTAEYNNGTTKDVSDAVSYSGFSSASAGSCKVIVSYGSAYAQFTITVNDPAVVELRLNHSGAKKNYYVGDEFSKENITAIAAYENGIVADVTNEVSYSGFDGSKAGTCEITASFGGRTAKFTVTVEDIALASVNVTAPSKTEYFAGEPLDTTGMKVTAVYSNSAVEDVTALASISGFDSSKEGEIEVTVTYGGKTASFKVNVKAAALTSLEVTPPKKTEYYVGDVLDLDGFTANASFENGTSVDVTAQVSLDGFDSSSSGEKKVTVTYGTKTAEFSVNIADVILDSITLTPPTKTHYSIGEVLDTSGLVVTANYSNGTSAVVTDKAEISGFDSSSSGAREIVVSYGSKTAVFTVEISDNKVVSIAVTLPEKTTYYIGEQFSAAGLTVTANYENSTSEIVTDRAELTGFDSETSGVKTITAAYGGFTDTFEITVLDVSVIGLDLIPPTKTEYSIGEELDLSGMTVTAQYTNGTSAVVTDLCTVEGYDSSSEGIKTVAVTYSSQSVSFEVTVVELNVESITVEPPKKTQYFTGEELDPTGMIVTSCYSNGTSENVTDKAEISGFDSSKEGECTVTVSYGGLTSSFTVTITAPELSWIQVDAPKKLYYQVGDEFDPEGMKVTAFYSDGSSRDITEEAELTGYDNSSPGQKKIVVSFGGMSVDMYIVIEEASVVSIRVKAPEKTQYFTGDEFDPSGLEVYALYSNSAEVDVTQSAQLSGFDSETAGEKTVTVTYKNCTDSFNVTVTESAKLVGIELTPPSKTVYKEGEALDLTGMTVTANYSDGTSRDVTELVEVSSFDPTTYGDQTVTVTYGEISESFSVTVDSGKLLGDVNHDGMVDSFDALIILRSSVGLPTEDADLSLEAADMNFDGTVDSADALLALRASIA